MANYLGRARRSTIVMQNSPGAIIESVEGKSAVAAIISGIDFWSNINGLEEVHEPRLAKILNVQTFRKPPVLSDEELRQWNSSNRMIPVFHFPEWLLCSKCGAVSKRFFARPNGQRTCQNNCDGKIVPFRFVAACSHGHLEDFPVRAWVHPRESTCRSEDYELKSTKGRMGLSGLKLICKRCNLERSMEGVFGEDAIKAIGVDCKGNMPWLRQNANEQCLDKLRALQRGASNLHFPVVESALSIPPWDDRLGKILKNPNTPEFSLEETDQEWEKQILKVRSLRALNLPMEFLINAIRERLNATLNVTRDTIRSEEYKLFTDPSGRPAAGLLSESEEFEIIRNDVPNKLTKWVTSLVEVKKVREVRAISGFTRIKPFDGTQVERIAPISNNVSDWLPAVEIFGEGIFVGLNHASISTWLESASPLINVRIAEIAEKIATNQQIEISEVPVPDIVEYLVHSLSHALIREISLQSGYSAAALRERVYAKTNNGRIEMAGILITAGEPGSDGTLGGLSSLARSDSFELAFMRAIQTSLICSNDPICNDGIVSESEMLNMAACHSCLLLPETSCEKFNTGLDRAVLVGTIQNPSLGFFSELAVN